MNQIVTPKQLSFTRHLRGWWLCTILAPWLLVGVTQGMGQLTFVLLATVMVGTTLMVIWLIPVRLADHLSGLAQGLRNQIQDGTSPVLRSPYLELDLVRDSGLQLAQCLHRLKGESSVTIEKIASVHSEIIESCKQQANGARHQSQAVSETTAAAAELSQTSEHIGANIHNISQMAEHVLSGMETIKLAADQTNQILTSLNEKSKQIGHITELIDDVANQTNLLAVNASIEAARAGEHGRGFTVVADQIGKLADSTAKSTKDITALVEIIQHEMSNAIIAMEQSLTGVDEEIRLTKESAVKSREIAMNANQQINGARQIAEAMTSIDTTMKQIVTDAQQSASLAGELAGVADGLSACMIQVEQTAVLEPHQVTPGCDGD